MNTVLLTGNLLGGLAIFLFGMKLMSDGLQKMAGVKLRQWLAAATTNRFTATLSGMLVTTVIQSSSATTVMVVGFTSAGLLTLYQALGVIFGANIGTTLTAWIISIFGFKVQISLFALPVIALGFFGQFLPARFVLIRRGAEAAVGFGFLFLGLDIMKNAIPADFSQSPWLIQWLSSLHPNSWLSLMALLFTGTILTVLLQSSSAVMALTLTCAAAGIINFPTACALVLGENIGTTVTANLAAIGAPKNARRAALGHFLFNFFGVIWVSIFFHPFISFINWIVPGNPNVQDATLLTSVLPYHISAFHTVFNMVNTLILLPLLPQLATLTTWLIPKTQRENQLTETELRYLNTHLHQTPELAILAARRETERMLHFVIKQTNKLLYALKTDDSKLQIRLLADIETYEKTTDILEHKINVYLTQMMHGNLSRHTISQIRLLFELTNRIESMGDCGQKIAQILGKFQSNSPHAFAEVDLHNLEQLAKQSKKILKLAQKALSFFPNILPQDISISQSLLTQCKQETQYSHHLSNQLRQTQQERLSQGEPLSPASITAYADILRHFERLDDYALRITEEVLSKPSVSAVFHKSNTIAKELL